MQTRTPPPGDRYVMQFVVPEVHFYSPAIIEMVLKWFLLQSHLMKPQKIEFNGVNECWCQQKFSIATIHLFVSTHNLSSTSVCSVLQSAGIRSHTSAPPSRSCWTLWKRSNARRSSTRPRTPTARCRRTGRSRSSRCSTNSGSRKR